MTLLTQNAYASHRKAAGLPGATHAAVAKAIKSGRLAKSLVRQGDKVLIDPRRADAEWAANTNGVMQRGDAELAAERIELDALGIMRTRADAASEPASLADARALKEHYLALSAKLDYEIESGKLIEAEAARRAAFAAARKARDMLLTIADRLAPVVAGLSDQFECHQVIAAEVRRVCDELNANPIDNNNKNTDGAGAIDA